MPGFDMAGEMRKWDWRLKALPTDKERTEMIDCINDYYKNLSESGKILKLIAATKKKSTKLLEQVDDINFLGKDFHEELERFPPEFHEDMTKMLVGEAFPTEGNLLQNYDSLKELKMTMEYFERCITSTIYKLEHMLKDDYKSFAKYISLKDNLKSVGGVPRSAIDGVILVVVVQPQPNLQLAEDQRKKGDLTFVLGETELKEKLKYIIKENIIRTDFIGRAENALEELKEGGFEFRWETETHDGRVKTCFLKKI